MSNPLVPLHQLISSGDNFLVASHESPDGDALGSTAAMGYILQHLGKNFRLYNASGVPDHLSWMRFPQPVLNSLDLLDDFKPEWVIALDCGDPFRIGKELLKFVEKKQIINIDHHIGNPQFGVFNWVDPAFPAVGEMVAKVAADVGVELSGGIGEAIYLAIVSDTGNFSYGNTRPETLELAASIVRLGLNPGEFSNKYLNQWTPNRLKLWSEVLSRASIFCDGKIGMITVTQQQLEESGTTKHDCDGLVEFIRRIKSVRVAAILREDKPEYIKISLRSFGADDVQKIALKFGGGGHRNAAGGVIPVSLKKARVQLLEAVIDGMNFGPCSGESTIMEFSGD